MPESCLARPLGPHKLLEAVDEPLGRRRQADAVSPMAQQAVGPEQFQSPGSSQLLDAQSGNRGQLPLAYENVCPGWGLPR